MLEKLVTNFAGRLLRQPVAPYHETASRAEAEQICVEHGLACERDEFGNLLVRLQTAPARRPIVLAAHLDHPGFEIVRRVSAHRWVARFIGGVGPDYFKPGTPVRLLPGAVAAKLGGRLKEEKVFELVAGKQPAAQPEFAVWELEDFTVRRGRIVGRACDDLVGSACVLATLAELKRQRARVNVIGVLSRAEEDGFRGALALAGTTRLPRESLVISLETSRELPPVKIGRGVIVRVGDKAAIFDSAGTRFLAEVAAELQAKDSGFRFQRALMSGGTCEATAYQEFGYPSAAVCVALGNYHNCGPRARIAAEYVSVADAAGMVKLLVTAARRMPAYARLTAKLPQRLKKLRREAVLRLRRTA